MRIIGVPFQVRHIQVDGGSGFMGEFEKACMDKDIPLIVLPPRSPSLNGHEERFNRTIQEDLWIAHEDLLFTDLLAFNDKLADGLIRFNCDRPHDSHGQISPLQFLAQHQPQCRRYWPHRCGVSPK